MAKEKNTAVAKVESTLPSTEIRKDWGAAEDVGAADVMVSKLFHQQALSKFTQDGLASPGDWCDSLTGEVIAKRDEELSVVIFASYKKLLVNLWNNKEAKYEWLRTEDATDENWTLPYEEITEEGKIRRQKQYNYFCLLVNRPLELPYVLSFTSTKIKAAKKINTMFAKLSRVGMPSASFHFNLKSIKETGDKGSWFGVNIIQGSKSTPEQLDLAYEWYQKVKASKVIVAEEDSLSEDGQDFDDSEAGANY